MNSQPTTAFLMLDQIPCSYNEIKKGSDGYVTTKMSLNGFQNLKFNDPSNPASMNLQVSIRLEKMSHRKYEIAA